VATDRVVLEDETGRFALDVSAVANAFGVLATGLVVAVRGREDRGTGAFKVLGVVGAGHAPQRPLTALSGDRYVCVVSGLGFGGPRAPSLGAELLLEYLRGNVGGKDGEEAEALGARIVQLVVAGGCVAPPAEGGGGRTLARVLGAPVFEKTGKEVGGNSAIVHIDRFLTAAAASLPTAVMPGEDDPANFMLPQQPMHRSLLPSASREANLDCVTNPYEGHFDDRMFLGCSGQNVKDFAFYNPNTVPGGKDEDAALSIMEVMLLNRHMAPTAPDTLGVYPFSESDPFVIESSPHVFFAGNQASFGTKMLTGPPGEGRDFQVRLVSVPRFDSTGIATLLNLRTLDCTSISFRSDVVWC
jgi:DNA polymerase delta subunit 2